MIAQYLDLVGQFNSNANEVIFEMSGFDYCVIQPIGVNVEIYATIDGGAIEGISDDSPTTATNFALVGGTQLSDNSFVTTANDGESVRLDVVGRYIRLRGLNSATNLFVMLTKIG